MSLREFVSLNRAELDKAILRACPNARLSDQERAMWVLNLEPLYNWARCSGVRV